MATKTPEDVIKAGARAQALASIQGMRNMRGTPSGWSREQWQEMLTKLADGARKAGVTDEELKAAGFTIEGS